jgi:hypothetical protein
MKEHLAGSNLVRKLLEKHCSEPKKGEKRLVLLANFD